MFRGPRRYLGAYALALAALALGCAHAPRSEVTRPAVELRCEEAALLVDSRTRTTTLDELRRSATYPLSLAVSGAGWVTDGALVVGAGVAASGIVCFPLFALEAAAGSSGNATAECFVYVGGAVMGATKPGIGRGIYRATRAWRCPDFAPLAREVLAVAACYRARNSFGDAQVAYQRLLQLRSDRELWECLPAPERAATEAAIAPLLSPTPPLEPRLEPASSVAPPPLAPADLRPLLPDRE